MSLRLDASYAVLRKTGVPKGWNERQVSSLVRIVGGGTPDRDESSYWREGTIPWITPTDLTANRGRYIQSGAEHISESGLANSNAQLVPVGSIIFSTRGTVGNLAITAVPLATNQSCEVLIPKDGEANSEFLFYLLNYGMFAYHRLAGGTTFGAITRREIERVHFAVPLMREQKAIASIIGAVNYAIDRAIDSVESVVRLKQAVIQRFFYSALGNTAYANRPTKSLPSGWSLLPTSQLILGEPKNGVSPTTFSQPPGTPTFSIAAIRDGRVDLAKAENLKYAMLPPRIADKFRIAKGDVLIVRGNANPDLVGKAGQIATFPEGCIYPDITMRVKFREDVEHPVTPEYAVLTWNHPIVHNQILRRAKTSNGTLKINKQDVKQMILPVPPPKEQEEITSLVAGCDEKVAALTATLKSLDQLKKSLMHDLLTGTVRVDPNLFKEEEQA
jgi:type I restriction enzyme S subunit